LDDTGFSFVVLAPLREYGQANSGMVLPKWATKSVSISQFVMGLLCPVHHCIIPAVGINQFKGTNVGQNLCIIMMATESFQPSLRLSLFYQSIVPFNSSLNVCTVLVRKQC
jgi:hypothetical protein